MDIRRDTLGGSASNAWAGGVVPAVDPTQLPPNASPRGLNSALAFSSLGLAYPMKRKGLDLLNATPIAGSPAILGFQKYHKSTGTDYRVVMSDDGRLSTYSAGATTSISTAFTAGTHYPNFEVAADLLFIVNGVDRLKFDGTNVTNFGITRPTVGTMAGAAGAAGSPNGTYELRVTYVNTATGHESSASNTASATVMVANQKISVTNVPVSADGQVNARRIYVRNTATQANFYLAGTINDNSGTSITLDFLDANLTTIAPTTSSHDRPPSGATCLAMHRGRMFVVTPTALYFSGLDKPEAFDPLDFETVNDRDGQDLVAVYSDNEVLLIMKERSVWALYGDDPDTWSLVLVNKEIGCSTPRTVVSGGGFIWWWSNSGLVRWNSAGGVDTVGQRLYGNPADTVNFGSIEVASAATSSTQGRLLIGLPGIGSSRANFILSFNIYADRFETSGWDPMDAACLGSDDDTDGIGIWLGGYAGQLFKTWTNNNDGVPSGTTSGVFTPSSVTITSITDTGASFLNTGGKLIERRVTIIGSDGIPLTSRPRITTNDGTSITFTPAVTVVPGVQYSYVIGGPNFQWDTPWRYFESQWVNWRFEYLFTLFKGVSFTATTRAQMFFDYLDNGPKTKVFTRSHITGSQWDSAQWDVDVWDAIGDQDDHFRIARKARSWKARIINAGVNSPFALLSVGVQAVAETIKD